MARPRSVEARSKVLAAASDLMAARGVSSLTIDEVATRSGVAKTTIYRHWPERTSLIVDAVNAQLEHVGTPDTGSLHGDLVAFFGGMMRTDLSGNVGEIIPCLIEAAGRDPEMAILLDRIGSQRRRVIEVLLERAIARGEIAPARRPRAARRRHRRTDPLREGDPSRPAHPGLRRRLPRDRPRRAAGEPFARRDDRLTGLETRNEGGALCAHSLVSATVWDRSGSFSAGGTMSGKLDRRRLAGIRQAVQRAGLAANHLQGPVRTVIHCGGPPPSSGER